MAYIEILLAVLAISAYLPTITSCGSQKKDWLDKRECLQSEDDSSVFDFSSEDVYGKQKISFDAFRGNVVLVVNVATYCALAFTNYPQLNEIQSKYENLTILAFPSNSFGLREQGYRSGTEIMNTIKYIRPGNGFEPNFPVLKINNVNGEDGHPLYTYLKKNCPSTREYFLDPDLLFYNPLSVNDIRGNFEKILIAKTGKPYMRYDSCVEPNDIIPDIEHLLQL